MLGVAPEGFYGTEVIYWPEVWVPMSMQPHIEHYSWLETRNTSNAYIAGRLKRGISPEEAEANLQAVAAQLGREHTVNEGIRLMLARPGLFGSMLRHPTNAFGGGVMLLGALVLLAACSNLAALLLARTAERARELAIRASIGAGRGRLLRQSLAESLLLALAGGAAGLALALVMLQMLSRWRAPLEFPIQFEMHADWRVLLFAFAAAITTGAIFGLGPARRGWNAAPSSGLKGSADSVPGRRWAGREVILPVQIAMCCLLVIASLVAVRGMQRSVTMPLGVRPDGVAVIGYDVGLAGYDESDGRRFYERALEEIAGLPGVESAAYASSVPLSIDHSTTTVYPESTTDFRPKNGHGVSYYLVSPGYFRTAGTRLLDGREFTPEDKLESPRVAIVNETFARRVVGTVEAIEAIGRRFYHGSRQLVQIVGVVEDGMYLTLTESQRAVVYFPVRQQYSSTVVLIARTHRPEVDLAGEMRQVIARLDSRMAVYGVGSLRQMLRLVYLPVHAAVVALGAFGLLALMLSVTGIYGLSAYAASRRTKEIGIRVALGARPAQILRFVFGRLAVLAAAGSAGGIVVGIAGAEVLSSVVYQATARDPAVLISAVAVLSVTALAAALAPVRRVLRVDPVRSLRHE